MAQQPANPLAMIDAFGPHLAFSSGQRLDRGVTPDRLVKTHCCFCGQQCGIQLKVKDNEVIGFEPWEEFPFNRGMLCPKGVKRYLQGSHPDRLLTPIGAIRHRPAASARSNTKRRSESSPKTSSASNRQHGPSSVRRAQRREPDHRKDLPDGQVCPRVPEDRQHRLQRPALHGERRRGQQEGVWHRSRRQSLVRHPEADVVWISGANVAECAPITTSYVWQARELGAKIIVVDPRITPIARTCDLFLPVKPGRDAASSTASCTDDRARLARSRIHRAAHRRLRGSRRACASDGRPRRRPK